MTTPHETALRDLCNFFIAPTQYCEACDEFYLANPSAYVHRDYLLEHAAEFAKILAASAGGQYVAPGSGMVVVPAEPSEAMKIEGAKGLLDAKSSASWVDCATKAYSAMLAAYQAAQPVQPPVAGAAGEIQTLMKFYDASSLEELVSAQCRHIEKLQAKLPSTGDFRPQRVREG